MERVDYDKIIELNLNRVERGDVFKSKSTLYRTLGFESVSYSKDKRESLDRHIGQYMEYESTNNKDRKREIVVTAIKPEKEIFDDKRKDNKGGNNSKYIDYIVPLLLYDIISMSLAYRNNENNSCIVSYTTSSFYNLIFENIPDGILFDSPSDSFAVSIYKSTLRTNIRNTFENSLKKMVRDYGLRWEKQWVLLTTNERADKTLVTYNRGEYTYIATKEDVELIEKITNQYCEDNGCVRAKIWSKKHNRNYIKYLDSEIKKYGYKGAYREYLIYVSDIAALSEHLPEYEFCDECQVKARKLFELAMYNLVYTKNKKLISKNAMERFKIDEPELYEMFGDDYKNMTYNIYEDYPQQMGPIKKLHEVIFKEPLM